MRALLDAQYSKKLLNGIILIAVGIVFMVREFSVLQFLFIDNDLFMFKNFSILISTKLL